MITYDSNSIYNRALARLQQNPDWQVVANNSVVSALLRSEAEALAEVGRYSEYLFKESKWDTAQNPNSILSMAGILGYQPARAKSATGTIFVSLDSKIHNVGSTISLSAFKDLQTNINAVANWMTPATDIPIRADSVIIDSQGHNYVIDYRNTKQLKSSSPWQEISVIQGSLQSVYVDINTIRSTATVSKLNPYLYIPVILTSCEDASTPSTRNFFKVTVFFNNGSNNNLIAQEYTVVNSLLLTTADDYAVEVYNDLYNRELFYFKFPNDPATGRSLDISRSSSISYLKIDYLQTLGKEGNISENFRNFTIETSYSGERVRLYGINTYSFINGKDPETISEIKVNAPKHYIKNYTVGTRESYENTILNTTLTVKTDNSITSDEESIQLSPKKVRVYGGYDLEEDGRSVRKTKISFIADGLEDIVTSYKDTSDTIYDHILDALNIYLDKVKSPQDILKFEPPNFVNFALGLQLILNREEVKDENALVANVRDYVDSLWGSNSDELDFDRSFYPNTLCGIIQQKFQDQGVRTVTPEVEAITKLDWSLAGRFIPNKAQTEVIYHTLRIPYNFDPVFLGQQAQKGFRNGIGTGSYLMRIDFMYKKPGNMTGNVSTSSYNTSIFIQDVQGTRDTQKGFYLINEGSNTSRLWSNLANNEDYTELMSAVSLNSVGSDLSTHSYQYPYQKKVYTDSAFRELITNDNTIRTRGDYQTDLGAIDDYLIYFSANYPEDSSKIGNGWLELSFPAIYTVLQAFSYYDPELAADLATCPLAVLQCNTGRTEEDASAIFVKFKKIIANYIDIYISMRPTDQNLEIVKTSGVANTVLMIDSADMDSVSGNNIQNLSAEKKPRMISISCKYEES